MNIHILLFSILFLVGIVAANDQQTTLTFLVEYEDEQEEDYIELGLVVAAQGTSLVNVMNEALKIAKKIQSIAIDFCQAHAKKKADCKQIVEIGNSNINPKYQVVKRQSKFMGMFLSYLQGFKVQYELSIKVLAIDYISDLADTILKQKNTKIISFEWKPLIEVNKQEVAVKQGTHQGEQLCDEIGMHLASISNVEEINESEKEQTAVYMFKVICQPGKKVQQQPTKEVKQNSKKSQQKKEKKTDDKKTEQKKEKKPQDKKQKKTEGKKQKKAEEKKQKKVEEKKQKKAEIKKQNKSEDKNSSKPSTGEL